MNPNRAPIAIIGLAVSTSEHPDLIAFRRSLDGTPVTPPAGPGLAGMSELLLAVLRDGRIEPDDPLCSQLGFFIAGQPPADGTGAMGTEGIRPMLAEYTEGALHALVRASEALTAGHCQLAVVLALNPSAGGKAGFDGTGVLLGPGNRPIHRAYAHLYPGVVRKSGDVSSSDRAGLLVEASARATVDPRSLSLLDVQAHGGAPTLGETLGHLRPALSKGDGRLPHCTVGPLLAPSSTVKALQGLCAVALALYERVLPPLRGECREDALASPFAADLSFRPWIEQTPRRAGVLELHSAVDAAVVLEQSPGDPHTAPPRLDEAWPVELILLSAPGRAELIGRISALTARVSGHEEKPLREIAREFCAAAPLNCRAALIARNTRELDEKLKRLAQRLESSANTHFRSPDGIYFEEGEPSADKTVIMIPGQGSQYVGMFGDLCLAFPQMQVWFERLHGVFDETERCPPQLVVAPPGIGLTDNDRRVQQKRLYAISSGATVMVCGCLALFELLTKVGVKADAMVGYSNGENAALIASGHWRFSDQFHFFATLTELRENDVFERAGIDVPRGACTAVNNVPRGQLGDILAPFAGRVFLALDNCPDQVVLFGEPAALAEVSAQLSEAGAFCSELPFDRGHHTPLYQPHADMLRTLYGKFDFGPGQVQLYSCITQAPFPTEPDQIRELAASQWTRCVNFHETAQRFYADGFRQFVEVGPGSRLSGFVHNTLRGHPHTALSLNIQNRPGLEQFLKSMGHLFALGQTVDLSPLMYPINGKLPAVQNAMPLPSPAPQPQADGIAGRILSGHFQLMQDFLESQRRSHRQLAEILNGRQAAAPQRVRPPWPMLGENIETGDGWFKARRTYTFAHDTFLRHHAFGMRQFDATGDIRGLPVIPFTFSMELVAEAGAQLSGWDAPGMTLSGLKGTRWLVADDTLTIEVDAHFAELPDTREKAVRVRVFEVLDAAEGQRALAFEGWVTPGTQAGGPPLPAIRHNERPRVTVELLNSRLFHGPLLISICGIEAINADGAELRAIIPPVEGLFQGQNEPALRIPAVLLDAVGQLVYYWLAEQGYPSVALFPFQIDRYVQFAPPPAPGSTVILRGRAKRMGGIASADIDILDSQGAILAKVEGLRMKLYHHDDCYLHYSFARGDKARLSERVGTEWVRHLQPPPDWFCAEVQGIWWRLFARAALNERERLALREMPADQRIHWILVRVVAKELALDWLATQGLQLQPTDMEAVETEAGFLILGEPLQRLPDTLCVRVETEESGMIATLTRTPKLADSRLASVAPI